MIEIIKNIYTDYKQKLVLCLCFVVVYSVGVFSGASFFHTGEFTKLEPRQPNYNTKSGGEQTKTGNTSKTTPEPKPTSTASKTDADEDCFIKGNIASATNKTYHMPGGSFYDRTIPEMCFNSEQEAVDAGFKKSSR